MISLCIGMYCFFLRFLVRMKVELRWRQWSWLRERWCNLKVQEREFLTVARSETAAHDMFDETSAEKVVWDEEVLLGSDSPSF
jgi:hypothetical protein